MGSDIAVSLHMSLNTFHRLELAQGVIQYAREQPDWRVSGSFYTSKPILNYKTWSGDGIISICHSREDAKDILASGLPVVDVVQGFTDERIVNVTCDNDEAGRLAGEHLLSTGFTHFAFCHVAGTAWSLARGLAFAETVGVSYASMPRFERKIGWWQNHARSKALDKFLLSLPPRTAILAGNDNAGVKITGACNSCGRRVPDDLAVMGIDGDELQCELSHPPLSTIPINGISIGYEAARRLDELMRDRNGASRQPLRIPAKSAILRASTNAFVCGDEAVRRALVYIRGNYAAPMSVADVAREAAVCRRTLEIRFRRHLDRSVLEEIHATRLHHAMSLLEDLDMPISTVFRRCGFMTHQLFYGMFKERYGVTPKVYRERLSGASRGMGNTIHNA